MSKPHKPFEGFAKVYTLSDENGNVFYVGCTTRDIKLRLACHITEAKMNTVGNAIKNAFIRSLDYKVLVTLIEEKFVTGGKAYDAVHRAKDLEYKWMLEFINRGCVLCNNSKEIAFAKKYQKLNSETI